WIHRHTAPLADCLDQKGCLVGLGAPEHGADEAESRPARARVGQRARRRGGSRSPPPPVTRTSAGAAPEGSEMSIRRCTVRSVTGGGMTVKSNDQIAPAGDAAFAEIVAAV